MLVSPKKNRARRDITAVWLRWDLSSVMMPSSIDANASLRAYTGSRVMMSLLCVFVDLDMHTYCIQIKSQSTQCFKGEDDTVLVQLWVLCLLTWLRNNIQLLGTAGCEWSVIEKKSQRHLELMCDTEEQVFSFSGLAPAPQTSSTRQRSPNAIFFLRVWYHYIMLFILKKIGITKCSKYYAFFFPGLVTAPQPASMRQRSPNAIP